MTGLDIFVGFVTSYIAGNLPSLKQMLSGGDDLSLQEKIDHCYQRALEKWCADDALRQRIAQQRFSTLQELTEVAEKNDEENAAAIRSLVNLWADELRKDDECAHFIQEQAIKEVGEKVDNLSVLIQSNISVNETHRWRGLPKHKVVEGYIRRYCSLENSQDSFVYYALKMRERHCLAEFVTGIADAQTNKFIIYSSAQTGKTTELKQLCWELQESGLYLPIMLEVRNNTKLKRTELPSVRFEDEKEIVVVIDALDEVNGQKYDDLVEEISGYAYDHPEMKIVLSCRSNYRREKELEQFCDLFLEELSYGDANDHINRVLGSGNGLAAMINENELTDFVRNPFFLNVLIGAYKDNNKQLPRNKAEIYRLFIEKSYNEENEGKRVRLAVRHTFDDSVKLLENVALGLSLLNVQTLSDEELLKCLDNNPDNITECLRYDLIRCENGRYSFKHNAFREWLVANYLKREGIERAKQLATQPTGRIKAEWYNIIMLWCSMYGKGEENDIQEIIKWLRTASLELIIYIDRDMLSPETRCKVFKGLMLEYKSLGIRMASILTQDYKNLIEFAKSKDSIGFIIDELQDASIGTAYYADLMCLCYFLNWTWLQYESKELTKALFVTLEQKTREALACGNKHDLSFLYMDNDFFAQKEYLERFLFIVRDSDHYEAIRSMVRLIDLSDYVDEYVDYILDKEKHVHNQHVGKTTHIVSRTVVYAALSKVKKEDNVKKILTHQFYNPHSFYRDEWEEYKQMMSIVLSYLAAFIKEGHVDCVPILENYYIRLFKDYHYHFDRNEHAKELLALIRNAYFDAGLREGGRAQFNNKCWLIFEEQDPKETERDNIRKTFFMAALWMTVDDVKEDFSHFDKGNEHHLAQASWYGVMPCEEVAGYANTLYGEMAPANTRLYKRKERQRTCFNDFMDYSVFKQEVLEMVGSLDKFETRKEHWNYLRQQEDGYNQYAYRFIQHYTNDNNRYDKEGIIKGIKNEDVYEAFFMKEIEELMSRPNEDLTVSEDMKKRCLVTAKRTVEKVSSGEQPNYFSKVAISLLLHEYFEVSQETLIGLLDYSDLSISKKDKDDFFNTEYTLFRYISERVPVEILAPEVIKKLKSLPCDVRSNRPYYYTTYIVENHINEGYKEALRFALSSQNLSANILEALIKGRLMIDEIKAASRSMSISDKLFCYTSIHRNIGDDDWVRQELEPEYKNYAGYDLSRAVRLLISMDSLDGLDYLVRHPDMMEYGEDYFFNYATPNAIPSLCYFVKYCHDHKIDGIHTSNSIMTSLERIATLNEDALKEVKQYLKDLSKRGEEYKYLNRYIIAFEDKYYASYPGISDIESVMELLGKDVKDIKSELEERGNVTDGTNTIEDMLYISYNWESSSQHTVDYLCYVLDTHGIPYKRDKKDCPYNDNIKDFMDAIRKGKMVIVVLSRPYLYSQNCMYELTGILENEHYKERILPVVMDDTIRSSLFYADLVGYWKEKKDEQEEMVRRLNAIDPNKAKPEAAKLKVIETIYDKLDDIKEYINWTNAENLDLLCATQFRLIVEIIKKRV
ncbi:MAG: TIR domain-containing protein [Muribaculaceae bacterium]|nr:TIR domain-containing protein [Muribaculaceae bacterium]